MVTDNTPVLETYWTAQGRKRTSFKHELLHYINAGETALARFLRGYVVTALWASMDDKGNPLDASFNIGDIAPASLASAWTECSQFHRECRGNLAHLADDRGGHDFWLTRNSHGVGFFDEHMDDESAELAMQQLTHASHAFGEVDLYIGDDRKLHFSNERRIV